MTSSKAIALLLTKGFTEKKPGKNFRFFEGPKLSDYGGRLYAEVYNDGDYSTFKVIGKRSDGTVMNATLNSIPHDEIGKELPSVVETAVELWDAYYDASF